MLLNNAFKKAIPLTVMLFLSGGVAADVGDYGPFKFFKNLFQPPSANNPVDRNLVNEVTLADGTQVIDFPDNPRNHRDGFDQRNYLTWQSVTLDGDATGAKCADGSDYKFLVKRSARSSNMVVFMEGGGGCWSYESCSISAGGFTNSGLLGGQEGQSNPDSILQIARLSSLATTSLRPGYHPKFEHWTKIYLPYCTQDLQLGNVKRTYTSIDGSETRTVFHHGLKVQGAVLNWLKDNLERPGQLLMTGQSAGGFGSELLYNAYRTAMEPRKGYLLNDAGPIVPAPQGEDENQYPSQHAHKTVTEAWDAFNYLGWLEEQSQELADDRRFVTEDVGSISPFLSSKWNSDRFMLVAARKDNTISGFSYNSFFPEVSNESSLDNRDSLRDIKRYTDMDNKRDQLDDIVNYGYFVPGYRPLLGGHVLTFPLVESSTKNEDDGNDVFDAISSVMNDRGRVLESWEGDYGLWRDQNGRYNDCINYIFDLTDMDKKAGDVYIENANIEGNDLGNLFELVLDVMTGNTCLGKNPSQLTLSDLTGILPISNN